VGLTCREGYRESEASSIQYVFVVKNDGGTEENPHTAVVRYYAYSCCEELRDIGSRMNVDPRRYANSLGHYVDTVLRQVGDRASDVLSLCAVRQSSDAKGNACRLECNFG
jgi:hypothetical protein